MNGADLTELARAAGRVNWKGEPVACGCGQGVFGEDICPLGFLGQPSTQGHTVSNYIGTAPGAAAFVLFMIGPTAMAWIYGTGDTTTLRSIGMVETWLVLTSKLTLFLFQGFLSAFFMLPGCIFFVAHCVTSGVAVIFGAIHFLIVAGTAWNRGQKGHAAIIGVCLLFALVHGARFALAGLSFKKCNVYPGQRHISPECVEV